MENEKNEKVNMILQLILAIIFPIAGFYKIFKLKKWFLYRVIPSFAVMIGLVFLIGVDDPYELPQDLRIFVFVITYLALFWFEDYYLIIKWTREYNKTAI